jgi:Protein of unknown function (DUF1396).
LTLCALLLLTTALSACGGIALNAASPTPTPTPRNPQQLLVAAQKAMGQLKSVHYTKTADAKGSISANGKSTAIALSFKTDADSKGTNEASLSDDESMQVSTVSQQIKLGEIFNGNKLYIQNQQGKWFVTDRPSTVTEPQGGIPNNLYSLMMDGQIADNGHDKLDGLSLRHISSTLSDVSPEDIASAMGGDASSIASSISDVSNVHVDMWIDEATNYIHAMNVKCTLTFSLSGSDSFDLPLAIQLKLSKFNAPVTIKVPANPVPASSVNAVMQS